MNTLVAPVALSIGRATIAITALISQLNAQAPSVCVTEKWADAHEPFAGGMLIGPEWLTVSSDGRMVFRSDVLLLSENQGIFTLDATGLTKIALGCGGTGGSGVFTPGCGEPTPVGGTFAGFFTSPALIPVVNARGDVLFLGDVFGGSSPRALFLFEAWTQTIRKVVAVGDPSPTTGTIMALGLGTLNDSGEVACLVSTGTPYDSMVLRWNNGTLSSVAAAGNPAPGGGGGQFKSFMALTLTCPDGTYVGVDYAPAIDNAGRIVFWAYVTGSGTGQQYRGIFIDDGTQISKLVQDGDAVPGGGGIFLSMMGPVLSAGGEVGFVANDTSTGPPQAHPAWFIGPTDKSGRWRRALRQKDMIAGFELNGFSISKAPYNQLDAQGNLLTWANLRNISNNISHRELLLVRRDGSVVRLIKEGDPLPGGGTVAWLPEWCSMSAYGEPALGIGANLPGGALGGGYYHMRLCCGQPTQAYCTAKTNSLGCSPSISGKGIPSASAGLGFPVRATSVLNNKSGLLLYGVSGPAALPFQNGLLCVQAPVKRTAPVHSGGAPAPIQDCSGVFEIDMNAFAAGLIGGVPSPALSIPGAHVFCQWWGRDPGFLPPSNSMLSDALEYGVCN